MPEKNEYPSMDTTYEWARTAPEQLSKEADALDTKGIAVFTSASILIGVLAAISDKIRLDYTLIPFSLAFLCFLFVACQSLKVLWVRRVFVGDDPKFIREKYWKLLPMEAKQKYWREEVEKAYHYNLELVHSKGRALQYTIPVLGLEVVFLLLWLFLVSIN